MILNRQKKIALDEKFLSGFLEQVLQELKLAGIEVSVALVSDAEIAKWNRKYRHKSGPTDVLSFPALDRHRLAHFKRKAARGKSGVSAGCLGDLAIAPETAQRNAIENGRAFEDELRILVLHGVLHLLGYDHETDHGEMNRIEQDLRTRLGIA